MAIVLDGMVINLIALYAAVLFDRHQKRKLSGEADEIVRYWLKYKQISPEQILVIEVPNILRR